MTAETVCIKMKNIKRFWMKIQVLLKYIQKIKEEKRRLGLEFHGVLITNDPSLSSALCTIPTSDSTERHLGMNWIFQ